MLVWEFQNMDNVQKLKHTIDTLFGHGISKNLPKSIEIKISKKTGRIRYVNHDGKLLFTPRSDGGLAITRYCAKLFLKSKKFRENCIGASNAPSRPRVNFLSLLFWAIIRWNLNMESVQKMTVKYAKNS